MANTVHPTTFDCRQCFVLWHYLNLDFLLTRTCHVTSVFLGPPPSACSAVLQLLVLCPCYTYLNLRISELTAPDFSGQFALVCCRFGRYSSTIFSIITAFCGVLLLCVGSVFIKRQVSALHRRTAFNHNGGVQLIFFIQHLTSCHAKCYSVYWIPSFALAVPSETSFVKNAIQLTDSSSGMWQWSFKRFIN